MNYVELGTSGIAVSSLCYGTMSFGGDADEAMADKLYHRCRDAGINFFDCANIYSAGQAEVILGKLAKHERDQLVLTSKVGMRVGVAAVHGGLSKASIEREIESSLRRLQTDYLDVYFCHCEDPDTPMDETLAALDGLIKAGKIRAYGLSNWFAWKVARALGRCELNGWAKPIALQPMYSLVKRTAEVELLPMAQAEGLGVVNYSPLGGGLLTGKYLQPETAQTGRLTTNAMYGRRYADRMYHDIATRLAQLAARKGMSPVTLAIAWVRSNPAVTAPILGARNTEQLAPALAAAEVRLNPTEYGGYVRVTPAVPVATDRDEERG